MSGPRDDRLLARSTLLLTVLGVVMLGWLPSWLHGGTVPPALTTTLRPVQRLMVGWPLLLLGCVLWRALYRPVFKTFWQSFLLAWLGLFCAQIIVLVTTGVQTVLGSDLFLEPMLYQAALLILLPLAVVWGWMQTAHGPLAAGVRWEWRVAAALHGAAAGAIGGAIGQAVFNSAAVAARFGAPAMQAFTVVLVKLLAAQWLVVRFQGRDAEAEVERAALETWLRLAVLAWGAAMMSRVRSSGLPLPIGGPLRLLATGCWLISPQVHVVLSWLGLDWHRRKQSRLAWVDAVALLLSVGLGGVMLHWFVTRPF